MVVVIKIVTSFPTRPNIYFVVTSWKDVFGEQFRFAPLKVDEKLREGETHLSYPYVDLAVIYDNMKPSRFQFTA